VPDTDMAAHLALIQQVIARLAQNSFSAKGWTITLVVGILALSAKQDDATGAMLGVLPVVMFWGLDALYLRRERLFRRLYEAVRSGSASVDGPFTMNVAAYEGDVPSWARTLGSHVQLPFYGIVLATTVAFLVAARRGW
jgi:hypothetical protein